MTGCLLNCRHPFFAPLLNFYNFPFVLVLKEIFEGNRENPLFVFLVYKGVFHYGFLS